MNFPNDEGSPPFSTGNMLPLDLESSSKKTLIKFLLLTVSITYNFNKNVSFFVI